MSEALEKVLAQDSYQSLRTGVATGTARLLVVLGAGASASGGMPTWTELRDRLVGELRRNASNRPEPQDARDTGIRAELIARESDLWRAFSELRSQLGEAEFSGQIHSAFASSDSATIPSIYAGLWRLPIRGMVTLNIDAFARRSFTAAYPSDPTKFLTGNEAGRLRSLIDGTHKFVVNLHGHLDDPVSWVFTQQHLDDLRRNRSYLEMLRGLFSSYTVVFIGVTADDVALGGPLAVLREEGIIAKTHYWITPRFDEGAREWASRSGVRIVKYDCHGGDHGAVEEMLEDLRRAREPEFVAPPVALDVEAASAIEAPSVLTGMDVEHIRATLNSRASALLLEAGGEEKFASLLDDYDHAVHRAWYVTTKAPDNRFLGHVLHREVARGAFGRVFEASERDGTRVALKLMKEDMRNDRASLAAFRRGVRAMRILERRGVRGMVSYRSASEIPAFVVMEFVDGPDLKQAKDSGLLSEWHEILAIGRDVTAILKEAHDVPERVLHRDVRPANIMIRNGWNGEPGEFETVVLDFDLSTYRGTTAESVLPEGSALGYLAPEQLSQRGRRDSREAAVDTFGVGMTLLFLVSGEEPPMNYHLMEQFESNVSRACRQVGRSHWRSLGARYARLVIACTRNDPSERPHLQEVLAELERLVSLDLGDSEDAARADELAEELVARDERLGGRYIWDPLSETVDVVTRSGLRVNVTGERDGSRVHLTIASDSTGNEDRAREPRRLARALEGASSDLRSGGWKIDSSQLEVRSMVIQASVAVRELWHSIDPYSRSLSKAAGRLA